MAGRNGPSAAAQRISFATSYRAQKGVPPASARFYEQAMIRERTWQRPKLTPEQKALIIKLVESGEQKAADVARSFRVSKATVFRILDEHRQKALAPK
jgi:DNA invertase Pin-like site-specific DNA recombinase